MGIQLNPSDGLRNVSSYPTNPTTEAAAREQIQSVIDQVVTQTNSELVSLSNLASLGSNGWFKDKKTDLIIQWGKVDISANNNAVNVNFPMAFPNNCLSVTISNAYVNSAYVFWSSGIPSKNAYIAYVTRGDGTMPTFNTSAYWIAIGN